MKEPTEKELNELLESIGRMDINPSVLATQEHLEAGHPVCGHADGLSPDELVQWERSCNLRTYFEGLSISSVSGQSDASYAA